jgi:hypothetical protein
MGNTGARPVLRVSDSLTLPITHPLRPVQLSVTTAGFEPAAPSLTAITLDPRPGAGQVAAKVFLVLCRLSYVVAIRLNKKAARFGGPLVHEREESVRPALSPRSRRSRAQHNPRTARLSTDRSKGSGCVCVNSSLLRMVSSFQSKIIHRGAGDVKLRGHAGALNE